MPCLNEAETLGECVRKAQRFFAEENVIGEVVIGDNGSSDGSQAIAQELGCIVVPVKERGYGSAVSRAVEVASGKYVIMGDSDGSYDFRALGELLAKLRAGSELVVGNRFAGKIQAGAMPWKNQYIGNPLLSGIGRLIYQSPVRDFHCGQRGFTKSAFLRMNLSSAGMEFASEMVVKAVLGGIKMAEVPIILYPAGRRRAPHLRPFRDGLRHLWVLLKNVFPLIRLRIDQLFLKAPKRVER